MTVNFLSINTFSTIPLIRYILESLANTAQLKVTHCCIETQPLNLTIKHTEKRIGRFRNSSQFNNQHLFFKLFKYARIYFEIILICIKKKQIIFLQDYQLLSFILSNSFLLSIFNTKVVYFQFELVDYDLILPAGKRRIKSIARNIKHLDFAIFPEINRLKYFSELTKLELTKSFIIPNSCRLPIGGEVSPPELLRNIPSNAIVFGHIGNIGPDHYLSEFLEAIDQMIEYNVYFIMVGRQSETVNTHLKKTKNPNFISLSEVPHEQLRHIYPLIHYGLILYKGVDKNFEFCAPNKLYEYWSYGIPVIGHKLTGLKAVIIESFLGRTIDFDKNELSITLKSLLNVPLPDRRLVKTYFEKKLGIDFYLPEFIKKIQLL